MATHIPRQVPNQVPLASALGQNDSLSSLLRRLRESEARLATVQACLPALLRSAVRPGPLDDESWTLLVGNASTAAKLRQLVPALESSLNDAGWPARALRVKIMSAR
jgi:hypothetical protein